MRVEAKRNPFIFPYKRLIVTAKGKIYGFITEFWEKENIPELRGYQPVLMTILREKDKESPFAHDLKSGILVRIGRFCFREIPLL